MSLSHTAYKSSEFDISHLATKADLQGVRSEIQVVRNELKAEMHEMKSDLLKWMIGMQLTMSFGIVGAIIAVLKYVR
ncbi:MAG: hypothetical protein ACK5WS_02570 [Alphaproteobacteria bacterium]|jgi:hypothetical protein|nr:hypothetical protein [Candidatus Jidaibacter sp.]